MVNYKSSKNRAKETATFRFTSYEKELLDNLAKEEGITKTNLIRKLIFQYAKDRQLKDDLQENADETMQVVANDFEPSQIFSLKDDSLSTFKQDNTKEQNYIRKAEKTNIQKATCFEDLATRFKIYFKIRSDKMQKELEETINFVTSRYDSNSEPIFPFSLTLENISTEFLHNARERLKNAPIKFPQKNLHLNYLRMMFNYGLKENLVSNINPSIHLRTFSAKEVADAFPPPVGI
jgi:predicted DNA-binding protein